MYKLKHDSIIRKDCNQTYHDTDLSSTDILLLSDNTQSRWRSEINTVNNGVPWQTHSGYHEKMLISKTTEDKIPNKNIIKL